MCRTVYRNYGNTYFHEACYFPERMVQLNETGELASVVAVAADGEVVGHYALERPNLTRVAERGMAVVAPAHRGRDLMTRMRTFIEEEAVRLGLIGVWSVAVTKHTYSQQVNETFESDVCGLMLAGGPESQVFRGLEDEGQEAAAGELGRVLHLRHAAGGGAGARPGPPPCGPRTHLRGLEHRRSSGTTRCGCPQGDNAMDVTYSRELDAGTIKVTQVGEDTVVEVRRATEDLFGVTGAEVVFLEPPAGRSVDARCSSRTSRTSATSSAASAPASSQDGDALMLQCLGPNVHLDPDQIEVANPFAAELVEYCFADRARVTC